MTTYYNPSQHARGKDGRWSDMGAQKRAMTPNPGSTNTATSSLANTETNTPAHNYAALHEALRDATIVSAHTLGNLHKRTVELNDARLEGRITREAWKAEIVDIQNKLSVNGWTWDDLSALD